METKDLDEKSPEELFKLAITIAEYRSVAMYTMKKEDAEQASNDLMLIEFKLREKLEDDWWMG